ncbi:hypothetical protein [Streptosporangium roseum]|uniref:hypothetical protein n=1 Tax=Streptosporangium roseum TaxID=2001 RepID=UPI0001A3E6A0|nr:hypothetical protein [Streptosporangium roseum]
MDAVVQVNLPIVADTVALNRHARKELIDAASLLAQRKSTQVAVLKEALTAAGRTSECRSTEALSRT